MKKLLFPLLLLLVGSFSLSANDYSEAELQRLFMNMLADEGIEGWVDEDGDVQFEYDDKYWFIEVNETDNEFFRVVLYNIWPIESNSELIMANNACNEVNKTKKAVKAYTVNDNVWIAVEMFLDDPKHSEPVLMRCMDVIIESVDLFVENM